jgi:hypothetical protein
MELPRGDTGALVTGVSKGSPPSARACAAAIW